MWFQRNGLARLHIFGSILPSSFTHRAAYSSSRVVRDVESVYLAQPKTVAIIGAPMAFGQPKPGTDDGPAVLRESGLHKAIEDLDWACDDKGDVNMDATSIKLVSNKKVDGKAHNCEYVGVGNERVMKAVKQAASEKSFVLTLGGDHTIGAGTLAGSAGHFNSWWRP
jgi:arginase